MAGRAQGRRQWRAHRRDKVRPTACLLDLTRERVRPARHTTPILGHFEHAGRTFSRTGRSEVVTVKPTTPLQPLIQSGVKPPSPMLAPEPHPLKPTTPMRPKNAPKTPNSHAQRRWRFQSHAGTHKQRRYRFQTTTPPGLQCLTGARVGSGGARTGAKTTRRTRQQRPGPTGVEGAGGTGGHGRASRRGAERSEALASRAAGPSGARNTRGATSNPTQRAGGPPPTGTGTPSSPTQRAPGSGYASPETSPATPSPRGSRRARPR